MHHVVHHRGRGHRRPVRRLLRRLRRDGNGVRGKGEASPRRRVLEETRRHLNPSDVIREARCCVYAFTGQHSVWI